MSTSAARPAARQAVPDAARPAKHQREPTDIHAFLKRMLAAQGRRVADADPADLKDLWSLQEDLNAALATAVAGQLRNGFSWTQRRRPRDAQAISPPTMGPQPHRRGHMSATSATQTAACPHAAWTNHDGVTPLVCAACGAIWPGEELPTPPPRHEGYGALADQPGWGERVRRMAAALDRDRDREL